MRGRACWIPFALICAVACRPTAGSTAAPDQGSTHGIAVTGQGQATAIADTAKISLGIDVSGEEPARVLAEAAEKAKVLRSGILALGIAEADVEQTAPEVIPRAVEEVVAAPGQAVPASPYGGFVLVNVTLRALPSLTKVVDLAKRTGAAIRDVTLTVRDPEALLARVRDAALADARRQAERIAASAGVRLGPIRFVQAAEKQPRFGERSVDVIGDGSTLIASPVEIRVGDDLEVRFAIVP